MGQLEKYGLYVLCLLIFLIAGVSIWGSGEQPGVPQSTPPLNAPANVGSSPSGTSRELGKGPSPMSTDVADTLDSLFRPVPPPSGASKNKPEPVAADAAKSSPAGPTNADDKKKDAPPPVVTPAKHLTYTVKAGDSFDRIARTQLGDARLAKEIAKCNPTVKPEKMAVGTVLELPAPAIADKSANSDKGGAAAKGSTQPPPVADGSRTYTIRKGDTLERIARAELGSSKRVDELKQLNPIDPTKLQLGQKIKLPAK